LAAIGVAILVESVACAPAMAGSITKPAATASILSFISPPLVI
jgi:hypothetical protein